LNRFVDAERLLRKSLKEVTRPQEELWIRLLLGNVKYFRARDLAPRGPLTPLAARYLGDAQIIYTRALERLEGAPAFAEKEYLEALLYTNLGNVKRRQALAAADSSKRKNLLREALAWTDRALETARKAGRDRLSVVAGANRAETALDLGDTESAISFAEWALRASKVLNYFEAAWRAELYLGRAAELKGELAAAAERYRSAVEIVETYRRCLSNETLRSSFLFNKVDAYQSLVRVLLKSGKTEEAFTVAERAKARTVLESLGLRELNESLAKNKPDLARLVNLLRRTSITGDSRSTPFAEPVSFESLRKEITELMHRVGKLKGGTPALAFLFGDSASADSVLKTLEPGEVLLEYFPVGDALALWKIDREGVEACELPGTWRETADKVARFVEGKVEDSRLAEELGAVLLAPLSELPPKLVIVPTGILYRLPFEALTFKGKSVVDVSETRYIPSAAMNIMLASRRRNDEKGPSVFALANPDTDYDGDGVPDKPRLKYAEKEVAALKNDWPRRITAVLGKAATEALWRRRAPSGGVLHLACHGVFSPANPWHSTLFLARGGGEDGTLEAWEILGMDLRKAELVTLSGCETGVTTTKPGDDIVGLPRGFLLAGAPSLVASLWPVEDRATAYLMSEFYRRLSRGRPPASALREAKLALRRNPRLGSRHNWAAFVLFGRSAGPISVRNERAETSSERGRVCAGAVSERTREGG